jgi:NADPH:quinone reductase-like Zn-dependent oxidoreductase
VLIRIKAFGLNRSELFTRRGLSLDVVFPRILGIEAVGLVEEAPRAEFAKSDIVATAMGSMGRNFDGWYAGYTCVPAEQVYFWWWSSFGYTAASACTRPWCCGRPAPVVIPLLFALPILALLGFAHAGEAVLTRLASDAGWRALVEQNLLVLQELRHRLDVIADAVFLTYGAAGAAAVAAFASNIARRRHSRILVSYDGGLFAIGRAGMSGLDVSRAKDIPHATPPLPLSVDSE